MYALFSSSNIWGTKSSVRVEPHSIPHVDPMLAKSTLFNSKGIK